MDKRIMILAAGISSRMKKPVNDKNIREDLCAEADTRSKGMIGVGKGKRPFLDYLLHNIKEAGYEEILFIINEKDHSIRSYYDMLDREESNLGSLKLSYAVQRIPSGRKKPLGTADAVLQGLIKKYSWSGGKFTVCNSDNLYSVEALKTLLHCKHKNGMISYDLSGLRFHDDRHKNFAVISTDKNNYLESIIEKPREHEMEKLKLKMGYIAVSMNIFRFDYDLMQPYFENTPINNERDEKELPSAIKLMLQDHPDGMFTYKMKEHVPDMTCKTDLQVMQNYLDENYNDINF